LDPLLGFFHEPAYGRESLACDLVEPLRPRLDSWVWWLFRKEALRAAQFAHDKGACLLNKTGRGTFFAAYEAAAPRWRRYLRLQAYRLGRELLVLAPDLAIVEDEP
jgi:CRISPR-associated protein Cas1